MALVAVMGAAESAPEVAGAGVETVSASVSGNVLSWSGSYSCEAGPVNSITVPATDMPAALE